MYLKSSLPFHVHSILHLHLPHNQIPSKHPLPTTTKMATDHAALPSTSQPPVWDILMAQNPPHQDLFWQPNPLTPMGAFPPLDVRSTRAARDSIEKSLSILALGAQFEASNEILEKQLAEMKRNHRDSFVRRVVRWVCSFITPPRISMALALVMWVNLVKVWIEFCLGMSVWSALKKGGK